MTQEARCGDNTVTDTMPEAPQGPSYITEPILKRSSTRIAALIEKPKYYQEKHFTSPAAETSCTSVSLRNPPLPGVSKRDTSRTKTPKLSLRGPFAGKGRNRVTKASKPLRKKPTEVVKRLRDSQKIHPQAAVEASVKQVKPPHKLPSENPTRRSERLFSRTAVRAPLSSEALRLLNAQTGNRTLSQEYSLHESSGDEDGMPRSVRTLESEAKKELAYSAVFLTTLKKRGVLDEQFSEGEPDKIKRPKNYRAIEAAINKKREHSPEPNRRDYREYVEELTKCENEEDMQTGIFSKLFGEITGLPKDQKMIQKKQWTHRMSVMGTSELNTHLQQPSPDYVEGLTLDSLPEWALNTLAYANSNGVMFFPNFIVEIKRDGSMFKAHSQNRHSGSIASQAFHEYYTKVVKDPAQSWDIARVGSIEYNGIVVIGNVHWVSKSDLGEDGVRHRKYHMAKVLCQFAHGLDYKEFNMARRRVRNFRDYFMKVREDIRIDCNKRLSAPAASVPGTSTQGRIQSNPTPSLSTGEDEHESESTERLDLDHEADLLRQNSSSQPPHTRSSKRRGANPVAEPKRKRGRLPNKVIDTNQPPLPRNATSLTEEMADLDNEDIDSDD